MKIFLLLLMLASTCFASGMVADIYVKIENESASVDSILVSYGNRIFVPPGTAYQVSTYAADGSFSSTFDIPKDMMFYDSPDGGGAEIFEQNPVELFLPFYSPLQMIEIKKGGKILLSTQLEPYVCNRNSVCESSKNENALTCPSDCASGMADRFCDNIADGKCDPDCISAYDPDCIAEGENKSFEDVSQIGELPLEHDSFSRFPFDNASCCMGATLIILAIAAIILIAVAIRICALQRIKKYLQMLFHQKKEKSKNKQA